MGDVRRIIIRFYDVLMFIMQFKTLRNPVCGCAPVLFSMLKNKYSHVQYEYKVQALNVK